jgi:hypothetical protein
MKVFAKNILNIFNILGIDLIKLIQFFLGLPKYLFDYISIQKQINTSNKDFKISRIYPCLNDRFDTGGTAKGHYFHQDLLVARRIFHNRPIKHVDIGSRVDGFVAHVASFRQIEVFDIRKNETNIPNIKFHCIDFMQQQNDLTNYCDSVSSLHVIEHFGLGRYGDPINLNGHLKGIENITKFLQVNGKFYFSVPIGKQRIEFNAHRVFDVTSLIAIFNNKFRIDFFSFVDDKGCLNENVKINNLNASNNFGCTFGCGIFELTKL